MDEWMLVRSLALRIGATGDARLVRALDGWADTHADWLNLGETHDWAAARAALADERACATPHPALAIAAVLADLLALDAIEARLFGLLVAADRLPRFAALLGVWSELGRDLPALLGGLAGTAPADAARIVRRSAPLRFALVTFRANREGVVAVDLSWALTRVLDRSTPEPAAVLEALVGARQAAQLTLDDFAGVADADFLVRLLRGAVATRAIGVNILIHGPPGTGKTEFARTLAAAAGVALHGVGEADDDGDEPTRYDRVTALRLAQQIVAPTGGAVLLFDEMEDFIGDAERGAGDWFKGRPGSKVFVNRLLETNPVPVIWTTNAIGNVDAAILRRMSFVLELGLPSPSAARRMLARIAAEEGVVPGAAVDALLDVAPEAATVLRVAARSARLANDCDGGARSAHALVRALRGRELPPAMSDRLDLDLFEADRDLAQLIDGVARSGASDVSLLLTGPPGTGKTALAHHFARALDRPLVVKRASDLLSRWVGGTEAAIADAFVQARDRGHVLLFDEVDSLLFDRGTATHSWEAGQVNEMLTWLDHHPLPVVAATNHADRLDAAALRRFVFKLDLRPLGAARAARAFERFFARPAPPALAELTNLTPGDFAVVARQQRHGGALDAATLLDRLRDESAGKRTRAAIGFG